MSFRTASLAVFSCIVVMGGCLLWLHATKKVSDTAAFAGESKIAATSTIISLATVPPRPTQEVDGINFELATTAPEQEQGLSDRTTIPDNYAMLFVFPQDGQYGFWMKDMLVPLDMIWITSDGTIASVTPDVAANSYPTVFYPPVPIRYVLETRVGLAAEKGWTAGTHIQLPLPYGE